MSVLANHPQIEMVPLSKLRVPNTHARIHSDHKIELVACSIDKYGIVEPLVVDDDYNIVVGVARYRALVKRDIEVVPVIRKSFLTEADRRAYALLATKQSELSEWDMGILADELVFLFEADFNITTTGFTLSDLDLGVPEAPDEAPQPIPPSDGPPVTELGDLWNIGPDLRLFCGNARMATSYTAVLGDERATMIMADLPYNVPVQGHVSSNPNAREFAEASGEMSRDEFTMFTRTIMKHLARFSKDGSIHCHFMDWRHIREILDAADGVYAEFKQLAVWNKGVGGLGSFLRSQHELCFIFKNGRAKHINNAGLKGKGARYRTNVWDYKGLAGFGKGRDADLDAHSTTKNIAMIADAMLDFSHRGDLILDPTAGSGTTLLAAHRTNRRGAAIEIDGHYCDVAISRLVRATALPVIHADGRTFEEVATARAASRANEQGGSDA